MERVSVVGNAGSGKTQLARSLATLLGVPHVELDAIHHLSGWQPIDPTTFVDEVAAIASGDSWVIDGNYRMVVSEGPVWQRADTVVWLDLPRRVVMRGLLARTVRRIVGREVLWNGNREPLRNLYAWDPEKSIVRWAWTQHAAYRHRYGSAMSSADNPHLHFVRLGSRKEAARWLESVRLEAAK
jgi:adenylate kinase family enzyme